MGGLLHEVHDVNREPLLEVHSDVIVFEVLLDEEIPILLLVKIAAVLQPHALRVGNLKPQLLGQDAGDGLKDLAQGIDFGLIKDHVELHCSTSYNGLSL